LEGDAASQMKGQKETRKRYEERQEETRIRRNRHSISHKGGHTLESIENLFGGKKFLPDMEAGQNPGTLFNNQNTW